MFQVKQKANDSNWASSPYRGFHSHNPTSTFNEIVSLAFDDVTSNFNHAKHARYDEMYTPYLGTFRQKPMYTSIAPSLCINKSNRVCDYEYVPHKSYNPRQGEWLVERDRHYRVPTKRHPIQPRASSEPPLPPTYRRRYEVPTDTLRHQNQMLYWNGRALGLEYAKPFLQRPDYSLEEARRYQRIFWSPEFINLLPSCRHATHLMLSAY
ncbi:unnamed protein product [Caenorhabditis auriculariae]|uniref:Uncharacterized protein n=1 Tax=Caenorhabditis auriculariae TaxID=2777116 RepID=A0A8S1HVA4_9PELO|nr:unnamed protein product [Caenorhabditis auriculariae]